jgi:Protein of unknown function (DUF1566)
MPCRHAASKQALSRYFLCEWTFEGGLRCRNVRMSSSKETFITCVPQRDMGPPRRIRSMRLVCTKNANASIIERKMTTRFRTMRTKAPKPITLLLLVAPLLVGACMQIVGIEDPKRLEDKPGGETSGTGSGSSGAGGASSSSGMGGNSSSGTSGSWVSWPMPNPANTQLDYPAMYSIVGTDTVLDEVTKLQWQRTQTDMSFSWEDALAYCNNLVHDGHSDWRLPSRIELVSLIDYTRSSPAIDPIFLNVTGVAVWSATPWAGDPNNAWVVYFNDGDTYYASMLNSCRVLCVR